MSAIKCLNEIIKEKELCQDNEIILNPEIVLYFINSRHYSVRTESLKNVKYIYLMKNFNFTRKFNFLKKLEHTANEMFIIKTNLKTKMVFMMKKMRFASIVLLYGTMICSNSVFSSCSLLRLLKISLEKGIQ